MSWILFLIAAAALAGLAFVLYLRREPGGRGRLLPASLRAAALVLALLLVLDPFMPGVAGVGGRGETVVLLDDSWSMELPSRAGGTRWDAALDAVRATGAERVILLSGETVDVDDLAERAPRSGESRIGPALRAAIESGSRDIVVVSDGGVTDPDDASALLAGAGAALRVEAVGDTGIANAAIAAVDAPSAGAAGDTIDVRVDVAALGLSGDSLRVEVTRGGERVTEAIVMAPGDGRMATADLRMALPGGANDQRVAHSVRVRRMGAGADARDDFEADDARPFYVDVQARPRGIVLLSVRPDWEPRFLLPVLARSSGLPVRGYIRTPAGSYLTMGTGGAVARRVAEADVRADLERSAVAVLHGVGAGAPAWLRERLAHPRVLVFPAATADAATGMPAPLSAAASGPIELADWYVDEQPPASPVAPFLAQAALAELPPLTALRGAGVPAGSWAPLVARRDRRGTPRPAVVAGQDGRRRWVVATGSGYWRWSLRGGEARRAYGLFWSSLLGWLTEDLGADAGEPIRPESPVVERGEPVRWYVAGDAAELALELTGADTAIDTTLEVAADRSARGASLEPGTYRWQATAGDASAAGEFAVAAWSPEMVRPSRDLSSLSSAGATVGTAGAGSRRRLHASAWPWVLLVGLLCGEWVARRRLGLR